MFPQLFNRFPLERQRCVDGVALWKRILHAVAELQRVKPKVGEKVN